VDFFESIQIIRRRWYVVVPVVVVTLVVVLVARNRIDPEYQASSSVTLVSPAQAAGAGALPGTNPLLSSSGSLGTTAEETGVAVSGENTRDDVASKNLYSDFEVVTDPRTPIMQVDANGRDAQIAVSTVDDVVDRIRSELVARQTRLGVRPEEFISLDVLTEPGLTGPDNSDQTRVTAVLGVLGLALAIGAAFLAEGIATRMRRDRDRTRVRSNGEARATGGEYAPTEPTGSRARGGSIS
jgi:capsular polysaccharide biosynthesis protein